MNRLELVAQAPPIPDWYLYQIGGIGTRILMLKNPSEYSINSDYYNQKELSDILKKVEFDWRFYWVDEMIKRNDTETSSNNNRS